MLILKYDFAVNDYTLNQISAKNWDLCIKIMLLKI